jgi:hypothetical protein
MVPEAVPAAAAAATHKRARGCWEGDTTPSPT